MKRQFSIQSISAPYKPRKGEAPFRKADVLLPSGRVEHDAPYQLGIADCALEVIVGHIGWDNTRPENDFEQGGILIGEVVETHAGRFFGVATKAVPGRLGRGSGAYLELDHAAWKDMLDEVDVGATRDGTSDQVIGWYHTHPRTLGIFMSGVDKETQRRMFSQPWHFAVVLNPHRREWKVFRGKDAVECPGYFLKPPVPITAATPALAASEAQPLPTISAVTGSETPVRMAGEQSTVSSEFDVGRSITQDGRGWLYAWAGIAAIALIGAGISISLAVSAKKKTRRSSTKSRD